MTALKTTIQTTIEKLQADILRLEGFKPQHAGHDNSGLGFMKDAFPNGALPTGCIHEFITSGTETTSASGGFITGLLSGLMRSKGATVWISSARTIFPPALKSFGLQPERFIFIEVKKERDILWVMDEALKCSSLSAVVAEVSNISFMESRRLQLAVELSKVTGFVLHKMSRSQKVGTTACMSRWQLSQVPSDTLDDLPGLGYPKWNVKLLRMRNGKPGEWNISWHENAFHVQQESGNQNPATWKVMSEIEAKTG